MTDDETIQEWRRRIHKLRRIREECEQAREQIRRMEASSQKLADEIREKLLMWSMVKNNYN